MPRDTILFDINETVLDLGSLKPHFQDAFGDPELTATWFARLLHTSTVCALTGVLTTFAELAGHALDALAARQALALTDEQRSGILGAFAKLPPHPDVPPALGRLRAAGYRTEFDRVVSVEETGSFKPHAKVYHFVADRLDRAPGELRLVATHDWDTHGALTAGLLAAYVDRSGAPYHPLFRRPDVLSNDLVDLVERVIASDRGPAPTG